MAHVAKHDTKEKWEGGNGDGCWIGFLILGDTICINNQLEHSSNIIGFKVGRPGNIMVFVSNHSDCWKNCNLVHDVRLLVCWSPEIANESCVLHFHHIESLI